VTLKIRIFIWQVFQNRIADQAWRDSEKCVLCRQTEDHGHLVFSCPLANFGWSFLSEALGWGDYPRPMRDFISSWLPRKFGVDFQSALACFAGFAWVIWCTRNMMCMQKKFLDKLIELIFLDVSFVQKWRILMGEQSKAKVETIIQQVMRFVGGFQPSDSHPSDVGFI
jgi:hypothetical protein